MILGETGVDGPRIRVLLVIRWPVGGIRTFLKYVFRFFSDERFCFSIITVSSEGGNFLKTDLESVVDEWIFLKEDAKISKRFVKVINECIGTGRFDLIHAHGFTSGIVSAIGNYRGRAPMVLTSHDVINENQLSGARGLIKRLVLKATLWRCKKVHSVSNDAANNLFSFFPSLKLKRSLVIKNGVDTEHFRTSSAIDLRRTLGLPSGLIIIGFFGRFMGQKGFRHLIDAVAILNNGDRNQTFQVVCFGSGAYIREEKATIANRGLSEYFTFAPFMPDVSGAMKGCDLIAMPSLWEACPLQPMEALSAGVPFVGTDCIGLREVIADTPAVMVKAGSSESLAAGILECLALGRQPFEEFVTEASGRFEVRDAVKGIHNMYLEVLER